MKTTDFADVLEFWFPRLPDDNLAAWVRQFDWWFRGGGDVEIVAHFSSCRWDIPRICIT